MEKPPRIPNFFCGGAEWFRRTDSTAIKKFGMRGGFSTEFSRYWLCELEQKAKETNPTLMDIHYAVAAEAFFFEWDWALANKEFELASRNPAALDAGVWALALWATGNTNDAVRVITNRLHYDPLSSEGGVLHANMLFYNGQIETAQKRYEALINEANRPHISGWWS